MLDDQERLVSLTKSDLQEYEIFKTPKMPSYRGALTTDEIADLVAYLVSLKG